MDHNKLRDRFSPLLDGEMSPEERAEVEQALSDDADALRELHSLQQVDALFRDLPRKTAPEDMERRVRTTIVKPEKTIRLRSHRFEPKPVWPLLAAAAMLAITLGGVFFHIFSSTDTTHRDLAQMTAEPEPADGMALMETAPERQDSDDSVNGADAADMHLRNMRSEGALLFPMEDDAGMMAPPEQPEEATPGSVQPPPPSPAATQRIRRSIEAPTEEAKAESEVFSAEVDEAEPQERTLKGRVFRYDSESDTWYEQGYAGEDPRPLDRDDPAFEAWLLSHPGLVALDAWTGAIVFRMDGRWHRLEGKSGTPS